MWTATTEEGAGARPQGRSPRAPAWQRWQHHQNARLILQFLADVHPEQPSLNAIAKATGLHHQVVKRFLRRLAGLVRWERGKGRGSPYHVRITPQGRAAVATGDESSRDTTSCTPTCTQSCTQAVRRFRLSVRPSKTDVTLLDVNTFSMNGARSWFDRLTANGITPAVATDLVRRYTAPVLEAALDITERRKSHLHNPAGFAIWLLKTGRAHAAATKPPRERAHDPPYFRKWAEVKAQLLAGEEEADDAELDFERLKDAWKHLFESDEDDAASEEVLVCQQCGRDERQCVIDETQRRCLDCLGYKFSCADCGVTESRPFAEIRYRERFAVALCRRCYLQRVAQLTSAESVDQRGEVMHHDGA